MRLVNCFKKYSMETTRKLKYIIFTRHGERSDLAGFTPKLHKFDPELTERGKQQAIEAGALLKDYLINKAKIDDPNKIALVTSPFARTIQTSIGLKKGLFGEDSKHIIHVENALSERIDNDFENLFPKTFLSLYNNCQILLKDIVNENLLYLGDTSSLPDSVETKEFTSKRVTGVLPVLENKFLKEENDVLILVSHASPVDYLNIYNKYPGPFGYRHIKYCGSYIYSYDPETKLANYIENLAPKQD